MSCNIFLAIFDEHQKNKCMFSFTEFASKLKQLTPERNLNKTRLSLELNDEAFFRLSKDGILRNLCINPTIEKYPIFSTDCLKDLYNFIKQEALNENLLIQSIFLIHNSKIRLNDQIFMTKIFENFVSIKKSILIKDHEIFNQLELLFTCVLKSLKITGKITNLIDEIVVKNEVFNFKNLELKFIDCNFKRLNGFAGIHTIFVNTQPIIRVLTSRNFRNYTEEQKLVIIKLDFMATIVHEAAHIVLRHRLHDFNKSTPFLVQQTNSDDKILKNSSECGLECEKKVFGEAINWYNSLRSNVLNIEYCKEYLESIYQVQNKEFDLTKTKVVLIDENRLNKVACRYSPDEDYIMK
ncbi:hypothetical protein BpHYR1_021905 [Brachionus plicatilis]|uniref:Uncharacterized protein n=1 Tax=Brachionus plicatilis TaxID=10195 RepID=A0A3M7PT02_BRAPC|nr:hypothetical protein BpHYR1_021905 [Brachionus plicatilis]